MDDSQVWKDEELPKLRRPKQNSTDEQTASKEQIAEKSTLSVNAKEWYPSQYNAQSQPHAAEPVTTQTAPVGRHSVQGRLQKYHPPQQNQQTDNFNNEAINKVLKYLNESIKVITTYPEEFEQTLPLIHETLSPHMGDEKIVQGVIESIVKQAVAEHNFGYSGARLCALLDNYSERFRSLLYEYCRNFQLTQGIQTRNFTLFIAELFSQLNCDSLFATCLIAALNSLLVNSEPDDVKCACQTLKLTGMSLEMVNPEELSEIVRQLEATLPNLPSSQANLLRSVLTLRDNNWGREDIQQYEEQPQDPQYPYANDTYRNGWQEQEYSNLTNEELDFLHTYNGIDDPEGNFEDPDELCDSDEELQSAFRDFLVFSNQKR